MRRARYVVQLALTMAAYISAVVGSTLLVANLAEGPLRTASALLPVLPMAGMAIVTIRYILELDELARQVHLEGLAVAAVGTALFTFSYGFLETAGFPRLSMFLVWPLLGALWALGSWASWRRYR